MTTTEVRASLGDLAGAWDALVDVASLPSPFLRSWWLDGVAGPGASFVLVRDRGELVGGLALEEDRPFGVPRLRPIGLQLAADQLDLVAAPGRETETAEVLRTWLDAHRARVVDLVGCYEGARLRSVVPNARVDAVDVAPWTPLGSTFSEYLESRPRELRSQIDRPRRRLRREGVSHRLVEPGDADRALTDLRRLHHQVFGPASQFLPVFDRFARATPAGLARGELVMHEFVLDGQTLAVNVCFEVAGRLSYYQVGRDLDRRWRGSGTALMAHCVEHAIDAGCREFDLLRGTASYKQMWGDQRRDVVRLHAVRGIRGQLARVALPAGRRARAAARRLSRSRPPAAVGTK